MQQKISLIVKRETAAKLQKLADRFGDSAKALEVAIDVLWRIVSSQKRCGLFNDDGTLEVEVQV